MVGQNLSPPGWNRVKVSENLGATGVAPVAPAVTSLILRRPQNFENLHRKFVLCSASQIYSGDFAKYCGLLRIYELYYITQYAEQGYNYPFNWSVLI